MANSNNNPQSVIPDVEYNVGGNFVTVPPPEGSDTGKVLGAISEGTVGWVEDQGGGGAVQQQSDWTETDDTKVTFIQHKPANLVQDADYVHTDNNFTDADSAKLEGIAAGAEVNVQSNWNESDSSSDAFIANKPTQKPVVAGANISIVDGQDAVTISATVPTVDQTYNSSSTNAQSGVAVAGALAGVNQVPSSTSSDANKVLTVDSQGVPGWATPAAPAGGDSDEWWGGDPGQISVNNSGLRLKFKDLSYDPRNDPDSTFIAKFDSITKVSDGVYDFACKSSMSWGFSEKYLTDNEFVILALNLYSISSASRMFYKCTGLRAVYNLYDSGYQTSCERMFEQCSNLIEVRTGDDPGNYVFNSTGSHEYMFGNCRSVKRILMYLAGTTDKYCPYMCNGCKNLEIGPSFKNNVSDAKYMFSGCVNLKSFTPVSAPSTDSFMLRQAVPCNYMFSGCQSLQSLDGLLLFFLGTEISNCSDMFSDCRGLQEVPYIRLSSSGVSCSYMFDNCLSLGRVPQMDWGNITNASSMFNKCTTLTSLNDKDSGTQWYSGTLNASLTNVSSMFNKCFGVKEHLLDCYNGLSANTGITTTSNCFTNCGVAWNNPDLALIPSSWGGGAA